MKKGFQYKFIHRYDLIFYILYCIKDKDSTEKIEYRVWNPYRSKIAAAVIGGVEDIFIKPGAKVLYLGAASGTTVSHVSDIVGPVNKYIISHH